jgi:putative methionine-R-sulfoxide reductase with GAF domain
MEGPGVRPADFSPEKSIFGRDRRRAARHRVHSPAYVDLNGSSQDRVLELSEILNISEGGICIQAPAPMKVNRLLPLCLDLSETQSRIYTTGHVVWSDPSGKTGIRFPELPEASRLQLHSWLIANRQVGQASESERSNAPVFTRPVQTRPASVASYSSMITEWAELQKEVELFGPDLEPALQLLAQRALSLTWASGAAIALINKLNRSEMICRARAGSDSPELGAILQSSSGFSGECVRSGITLKCDDAATDTRVDRASCRALGIRSIVACPVKRKEEVIGILEIFSPEVAAFWDNDITLLNRLAGMIAVVVGRAERSRPDALLFNESSSAEQPSLFAETLRSMETQEQAARKLPRRRAFLTAIGVTALVGIAWFAKPWITTPNPVSQSAEAASRNDIYVTSDIKQLKKAALEGDAAAQYTLGVHYAVGDMVRQDYRQAMDWFRKSAERGNVRARGKIAALYWAGRGTPKDYAKAYYWALLAQAGGDKDADVFIADCAPHLSHSQVVAQQQGAEQWLHSHNIGQRGAQ